MGLSALMAENNAVPISRNSKLIYTSSDNFRKILHDVITYVFQHIVAVKNSKNYKHEQTGTNRNQMKINTNNRAI
ncbi:hypothetical protein C900_01916 [Fulvivirga imtechensis AK7]|uniref:Uncharacterized protein n=1 Tax=Fulvivirga imtechensis AK7 TaxID=1237149 RepID=L8JSU9_9BACT|nr:hypothetical protein C900_01916 [Fulvivirga imtechensis AK7]